MFTRGAIVGGLADNFGNGLSTFYPAMLDDGHNALERPNLRQTIDTWRVEQGLADTDIFYHCVATIHAPEYRKDNDDALRSGWPRIPLPDDTDTFKASAALGEQLSRLLDVQRDVPGVSVGALMNGLGVIALPQGQDYKVALGWGYVQINKAGSRIVMPGSGKAVARPWTDEEREVLGALASRHEVNVDVLLGLIGEHAVDVHINHESRWLSVPLKVWNYELGGHQVLKKWLSYRESEPFGIVPSIGRDEHLRFGSWTRRRIRHRLGMSAARYCRLNEKLIVADRTDHLAVAVDSILTEHRLGRHHAGAGHLLKQEFDCALLRRHTKKLTGERRRGQQTDHGLRRRLR